MCVCVCACVCVFVCVCVHACVCVCSQASHSRATLSCDSSYFFFMSPPFVECGRALSVAHVRPSMRASVCASFCASVRPSFKWVLCERNSSYNFIPILLKLYRCFCQGLKMCMTFGYNPQINFCHFFHSLNLVFFWAQLLLKLMDIRYLVSATPPTIFSQSF